MMAEADLDAPSSPGTAPAGPNDGLHLPADFRASLKVLVVDDDRALREGIVTVLESDGFRVTSTGRAEEALDMVRRRKWDIVISDLYLTPVSGLDILREAIAANRNTIFVVVTGNPSVATNVEALRAGAWDYLPKPFTASHLQVLTGRAAHAILVARETEAEQVQLQGRDGHSDSVALLGVSAAFRAAVKLARRVALTDASVMITGESGTGKELIAQFIHQHSRRASRPMVPINCAAMPEPLLESELFGHRRGAFTGADRDKPGLLETANGGTFFLDELTEMSLPLQAKLLRVLQDGVVRRVGSEEQGAVVDVRVISATNREPYDAVAQGRLREDLMYRLRVVPIQLPPLRERLEDIPLLATHFLTQYWRRHQSVGRASPRLSAEAIEFLRARPWRGNVRELQNVIEHLAVLAEPGQEIQPEDIPVYDDGATNGRSATSALPASVMNETYHAGKEKLVAQYEKDYLQRLVLRAGSNMSKAARLAGIDRTTLYRLMEKHGFKRDTLSDSSEE